MGKTGKKKNLLYKEESYQIVGACMEVHSELGRGFLEPVYQEALEIEFKQKNIPYEREKPLTIKYKDQLLQKHYNADFLCFEQIIVELKALAQLRSEHTSQVLNYLKATQLRLGILVNFGDKSLQYKRIVL